MRHLMKKFLSDMTTSEKQKIIHTNGIKIYPVHRNGRWAVHVEDPYKILFQKGKSTGEYQHTTSKQTNEAIEKTLDWVLGKIGLGNQT